MDIDLPSALVGAMATCALFLFCDFGLTPLVYILFGIESKD